MSRRNRRGRHHGVADTSHQRKVNYRGLKNPLIRQPAFSEDRLEAIHDTALRVIEELGIKVLNDEAREIFKQAGANVDEASQMVKIDRELVSTALASAPSEFSLHGRTPEFDVRLGGDNIAFVSVGGAPHISDLDRGKRPATLEDTRNIYPGASAPLPGHRKPAHAEPQALLRIFTR